MSKPSTAMKVLYGEQNQEVLEKQTQSLEKAGFSVATVIGRKAIQEALNKGQFDLVILGSTLSRDDRHHLPYMVKKASATARVLVMHTDGSRHPYVDGNIDTGEDMEHLVKKIAALQQQKTMACTAGK